MSPNIEINGTYLKCHYKGIATFNLGPSWPWSYGSCVLDTTLCDKFYQLLATGWWFSPGTPVSSTNKTDHNDITEILSNKQTLQRY